MTNKLKEEFYNKFKYDKPDYDEIADWWLSKIEEVIEEAVQIAYENQDGGCHTTLNNKLRSKYLGK